MDIASIASELTDVIGDAAHHLSFQTVSWPVSHWVHYLSDVADNTYDLDAPYQRGSVWTTEQRVAFIHSLIIGVPVAAVCVADGNGRRSQRVVDGKQRLETIGAFVRDEFTIPATMIPPALRPDTAELTWSQLPRSVRLLIERRHLPAITFKSDAVVVCDPATGDMIRRYEDGKDVGVEWRRLSQGEQIRYEACVYLLLNAGGTAHTAGDLEHAATMTSDQGAR